MILYNKAGRRLDSWSLGCLLYWMATFKHPFENKEKDIKMMARNICHTEVDLSFLPEVYSKKTRKFI